MIVPFLLVAMAPVAPNSVGPAGAEATQGVRNGRVVFDDRRFASSSARPSKPRAKPSSKPASRPAPKPAPKPASKPAPKPAPRPTAKPPSKPASKPAPKPAPKPTAKPPSKPASKPASAPDARTRPEEKPRPEARPREEWSSRPGAVNRREAKAEREKLSPRPPTVDDTDTTEPGGGIPYDVRDNVPVKWVPPHQSKDVRYVRPAVTHVTRPVYATSAVPLVVTYTPYYTRWFCHPWYRYQYSTTALVSFGFVTFAWRAGWHPPLRWGWIWVPGFWFNGYWHPGFFKPRTVTPHGYVYVPGWWAHDVYIEGYYRRASRPGWKWIDGAYLENGAYDPAHWRPADNAPSSMAWEPGLWDGERYIDGFWRPEHRAGFHWVESAYDAEGIFHAGYWLPVHERDRQTWIPGWFDGNTWIDGYWVDDDEVAREDVDAWEPPEGFDAGWNNADVRPPEDDGELPLAIPVPVPAQ